MQIANDPHWGSAVQATYPLDSFHVSLDRSYVELFSADRGKSYSTAPYLTDSGSMMSYDVNNDYKWASNITLLELAGGKNCDYILIKLREELHESFTETIQSADLKICTITDYVSFELDLTIGIDEIWSQSLNQKTRNQVRKAEKHDFVLKTGRESLLDDFFQVISECWHDLGTPTHCKSFYANIIEKFVDNSLFMVIYDEDRPISAALLIWNEIRIFHPFAGSLREFNRTSVNNLLYWRIIQLAVEKQLTTFDMGRSHKQQGTYRYKKSWGAHPIQLYYHYFLEDLKNLPKPNDHPVYQLATSAWKYLPLWLANMLGPKLIFKVL